jgi:hypothetical protein
MKKRTPALLALFLLLAPAAAPAGADWLVTREGGRVETRGGWEVRGKLVVFHRPDGALSSLRASEVDLEASRRATEEARLAAERAAAERAKPVAKRASVAVITDKDMRPAAPPSAAQPGEGATTPENEAGNGLIADWQRFGQAGGDGHVTLTGNLRNGSAATVVNLGVAVRLYDETGALIASGQGLLTTSALPPGEQAAFRVDFPGVFSFARAEVEPQGLPLAMRAVEEGAASPGS